jgi:hypothetical protein
MAGKNKRKKAKKLEREQRELFRELDASRRRRGKLAARVVEERGVLTGLLVSGASGGVAVGEMAKQAGISRIHAHRLISIAEAARVPADEQGDAADGASAPLPAGAGS